MIRPSNAQDFDAIFEIVNDAAIAYKGLIPADCWHEPYMTRAELCAQIADGVHFWCYCDGNDVIGVMGMQDKGDVALIRHAYVRTSRRNGGIGAQLLRELIEPSTKPVLIGTWKAASWAIAFYQKHGFRLVDETLKNHLLKTYWTIPERQVETSVVLADQRYDALNARRDRA